VRVAVAQQPILGTAVVGTALTQIVLCYSHSRQLKVVYEMAAYYWTIAVTVWHQSSHLF
jgi:hypothetical protein